MSNEWTVTSRRNLQRFSEMESTFYFSKPVIRHLTHFIDGMLSVGFTGKLTEIHSFGHHKKHRTTLSHFLKNERLPSFQQPVYILCDSWYT